MANGRGVMVGILLMFCVSLLLAENVTRSYPELLVVPLASERLDLEMKTERENLWNGYEIYLSSVATTMLAGAYNLTDTSRNDDDNQTVALLTTGVGAVFSGLGAYLAFAQTPYMDATRIIKKMKAGTTYEKLVRERMAEEKIDRIAAFNQRLRIFTGIAQVGLGVALLATSSDKDDKTTPQDEDSTNYTAIYAAGLTIAAGLINFILPHPSEKVSSLQKSYKKKILTYITPSIVKGAPGLVAGIRF